MRQGTASANDRIDAALLGGCTLVALACAALIVFDVELFVKAPRRATSGPPIAHLDLIDQEVRHRPSDMPVWGEAHRDQGLQARDSVFTDKGARAVLSFDDKTTIELGENTLIALETMHEHAVLSVLKGRLRIRSPEGAEPASAVYVKVTGQGDQQPRTIRVGARSDVALNVDPRGGADVTVVAGKAEIGTAIGTETDGPTVLVAANQRALLAATGKPPVVVAVPPQSMPAAAGAPTATASPAWSTAARFAARALPAAVVASGLPPASAAAEVQTPPTDSDQPSSESPSELPSELPSATPALPTGPAPASAAAPDKAAVALSATPALPTGPAPASAAAPAKTAVAPPDRRHPADGDVINVTSRMPVVGFAWDSRYGAATYTLQVARDAGFEQVVFEKRTRGQDANAELPPGSYYWRIRSHRTVAEPGAWSTAWRFALVQAPPPASATSIAASSVAAPAGGPDPALAHVRFSVSGLSGTYRQTSANTVQNTADHSSSIGLKGGGVTAGFDAAGLDTEFGYQSLKPSGISWYKSRYDMYLAFGTRFDAAPWIIPTVGIYQQTQTSDRTQANAPVDFIDRTTTFLLGLRMEGMIFDVNGQGLLAQARVTYLTNGQAKANFGDTQQIGIGYGYKAGTLDLGLTVGMMRSYLNASTVGNSTAADGSVAAATKDVRETLQSNVLTLSVEY